MHSSLNLILSPANLFKPRASKNTVSGKRKQLILKEKEFIFSNLFSLYMKTEITEPFTNIITYQKQVIITENYFLIKSGPLKDDQKSTNLIIQNRSKTSNHTLWGSVLIITIFFKYKEVLKIQFCVKYKHCPAFITQDNVLPTLFP